MSTEDQLREEITYRTEIGHHSHALKASLQRLSARIQTPKPGDLAWHANVDAQLETFNAIRTEVATLTPPETYAVFHVSFLAALGKLVELIDDFRCETDWPTTLNEKE
jgi:hypothetical protein